MSERVRLTQLLARLIGGISAPLLILLTDYRHNQVLLVLLVGTYPAVSSYIYYQSTKTNLPVSTYALMLLPHSLEQRLTHVLKDFSATRYL